MLKRKKSPPEEIPGVDYVACQIEKEIIKLYEQYNPAKLADVPSLMEKNKGKETKLLQAIRNKYLPGSIGNKNPPTVTSLLSPAEATKDGSGIVNQVSVLQIEKEIIKLYEQYNPAKLADVPSLMEKHKGKETKLLQAIRNKYLPDGAKKMKTTNNTTTTSLLPVVAGGSVLSTKDALPVKSIPAAWKLTPTVRLIDKYSSQDENMWEHKLLRAIGENNSEAVQSTLKEALQAKTFYPIDLWHKVQIRDWSEVGHYAHCIGRSVLCITFEGDAKKQKDYYPAIKYDESMKFFDIAKKNGNSQSILDALRPKAFSTVKGETTCGRCGCSDADVYCSDGCLFCEDCFGNCNEFHKDSQICPVCKFTF